MKSILYLTVLLSMLTKTQSYPAGAGHCSSGDAVKVGHGASGNNGAVTGKYMVQSNTTGAMDSSLPTELPTGIDHYISLSGVNGQTFKGFLFRLSETNGKDVSKSMKVTDASAPFSKKALPDCGRGNVGYTHNDNIKKSSVEVIINHDNPVDLLLEITVVEETVNWYYEAFKIKLTGNSATKSSASVLIDIRGFGLLLGLAITASAFLLQ